MYMLTLSIRGVRGGDGGQRAVDEDDTSGGYGGARWAGAQTVPTARFAPKEKWGWRGDHYVAQLLP